MMQNMLENLPKDSRIAVTGGTGMIGKAVLRRLRERGYADVLALARQDIDLINQDKTYSWFEAHKPSHVVHLAARVGGIEANRTLPAQFSFENTQMQLNVLEGARRGGSEVVLLPGSACTYPKQAPQPIDERQLMQGAMEPTNLAYAVAKLNGLVTAMSYAQQYGMRVVLPMPTNTYGPGDNFDPAGGHVIPALMGRFEEARLANKPEVVLWGTGMPLREFMYVDDAADALLFLLANDTSNQPINVGTGEEISIGQLAREIADVVGYAGKLVNDTSKPDGMARKCLNSEKLLAMGWRPQVGLSEGLQRMYAHHFKADKAA